MLPQLEQQLRQHSSIETPFHSHTGWQKGVAIELLDAPVNSLKFGRYSIRLILFAKIVVEAQTGSPVNTALWLNLE